MSVAAVKEVVNKAPRVRPATTEDAMLKLSESDQREAEFGRQAVARFPLLSAESVATRPASRPILKGLVNEHDIGAMHGGWGDGKSFCALDMLAAITDGQDWFGHRCPRAVSAVYVGLEGQGQVPRRLQALRAVRGSALPGLQFLLTSLDIRSDIDLEQLITALQQQGFRQGLICIDTLNASAMGMAENAAEDMGRALAAVKAIQRELDCTVLLVHHSGKDKERGMRGHSSLEGALDFIIEVSRDAERKSETRSMRVRKVKDGKDGTELAFELRAVDLGVDDDGDPITSAVVHRVLTEAEDAATHVGSIVRQEARQRAETVLLAGFQRLKATGIAPTDAKNSADYLPRRMVDMGLCDALTKDDLAAAMNRLMAAGVLSRGVVGHYSNRNPKLGLVLNGGAGQ